jgi:hypothetical protein
MRGEGVTNHASGTRTWAGGRRRGRWLVAALAALALLSLGIGRASALVVDDPARVDLKVLVVSADGTEPTFGLWKSTLEKAGVPYDSLLAADEPLTMDRLVAGPSHARYQAVVLATGNLAYFDGASWASAFTPEEWATLHEYESSFGIRQISAFAYPGPEYGLEYPSASGDLGGQTASVTQAGAAVLPYLVGPVPIDHGSWGYRTAPTDPAAFQTLVSLGGSPLAGVYTHPEDGREELVLTVDSNQWMLQGQLLPSGLLRWVTKGVYLGYERAYLGLHVDDVLLPSDRWDMVTNTTPEDGRTIRMRSNDVTKAVSWSRTNNLRLDFVFNGDGAGRRDSLTAALLQRKQLFGWINHTFTHPNLDAASQATIESEITQNIDFARLNNLPGFDPQELVTGQHSGLNNPAMPAALEHTGVRWIASDTSRTFDQAPVGPAVTIPRYPTNVYYNVGTSDEQLDEYNHIFYEACVPTPVTTCFTQPATWEQYVDNSTKQILGHILANDPRPHFVHQSNLAEQGTFYVVVDEVLRRYRSYLRAPLVQPRQSQAAQALTRSDAWAAAVEAGQVTAYVQGSNVVVQGPAGLEVPLTGTSVGDEYAGARSGWQRLEGAELVLALPGGAQPFAVPAALPAAAVAPAALAPQTMVVQGDGLAASSTMSVELPTDPAFSAEGLTYAVSAAREAALWANSASEGASRVDHSHDHHGHDHGDDHDHDHDHDH